jgi:hypothetical protein
MITDDEASAVVLDSGAVPLAYLDGFLRSQNRR